MAGSAGAEVPLQLQLVPRLVETEFTILMKNVRIQTQLRMTDAQQVAR